MALVRHKTFLETIKEYSKDNIPSSIMNKIRKIYISNPEFNPSLIKQVSSACEGLCRWVIAIDRYDEIFKVSFFIYYWFKIKSMISKNKFYLGCCS